MYISFFNADVINIRTGMGGLIIVILGILVGLGFATYTFTFGWQTYSAGNKLGAAGIFLIGAACIALPIYMLALR